MFDSYKYSKKPQIRALLTKSANVAIFGMTMRNNDDNIRIPSWTVSLIPIIFLIGVMVIVVRAFGTDALGGASQLSLILSSGIAAGIAMVFYRCPWSALETAILENIKGIGSGILILLMIGVISGTWMVSGIVPSMICYGLKIISPTIFLFAVCLICAAVSVITGSSWTTVATIGVAMIGIGSALGYPMPWTAGAIISGAYFGDKMSPLSDTTVLASSSAGVPLFSHIRYMLVTTVPSFVITLVIFLVVSLVHPSPAITGADATTAILKSKFVISPWLMLVPLFSGFLIYRKVPAFITLLLSGMAACVASVIAQPSIIQEVAGMPAGSMMSLSSGFKGSMISCFGSTAIQTGDASIDALVATRGMNGMMPTVLLVICAATFGGVLRGSGMIQSLTGELVRRISSRTSVVSSTVATGIFSNLTTGDQFLSIILTASLFSKLYKDKGYEERLLSRSVEDSATVTSVLIPWNSCGMTQSTVLHVPTLEYMPYCFFNIISPLMSIFIASIGYKIVTRDDC